MGNCYSFILWNRIGWIFLHEQPATQTPSVLFKAFSLKNTKVKLSLFAPANVSPLMARRRLQFNEAISFAGASMQSKCPILINAWLVDCNSAVKLGLFHSHHAWSCPRDLAMPRLQDSPFSSSISPMCDIIQGHYLDTDVISLSCTLTYFHYQRPWWKERAEQVFSA